jgi:hypothetical protein
MAEQRFEQVELGRAGELFGQPLELLREHQLIALGANQQARRGNVLWPHTMPVDRRRQAKETPGRHH